MRYRFASRKTGHTHHVDTYTVLNNRNIPLRDSDGSPLTINRRVPLRLGKTRRES